MFLDVTQETFIHIGFLNFTMSCTKRGGTNRPCALPGYSWVPCVSPWRSLNGGTCHMSSWGIRMELIRIAMRTSCHPREGSLHLAHADGPPCDAQHSSFHPGEEFCLANIPPSPDISQPDGRGGRFNFPGQTCPDPLIALTRRVFILVYSATVFSWSFLIFPTDILRYFALDICCLNDRLGTHLLFTILFTY